MKIKYLLIAALAGVALVGCNKETNVDDNATDGAHKYMGFQIRVPSEGATKADGTGNGGYTNGTDAEQAINSLFFYFYKDGAYITYGKGEMHGAFTQDKQTSGGSVEAIWGNGGKGVGLYRSEFLYMNADEMPSEDKQFAAYKTVIEQFKDGEGVIIRTLDIGGDKKLPYLPLEEEMNPFLGLRAIRLCLSKPDMFKTQLRAILRASAFGKTRIMFPMIGNVDEVRQAKAILKTCMQELDAEGVDYDHDLEVGIMVEIPSAAITADIIADEVSFFSIGTNDLCQYTLAVDRMNQNVSYLYDPLHPAILRLVQNVITQSHNKPGKFTGMCGEMAGDPVAALILLGLGLDEFSMSASSIPQVKKIIRSVSFEQAKAVADKAMTMQTGGEIRQYVQDKLKELGIQTM